MSNAQVTGRLLWAFENIPNVKDDLKLFDVAFGTMDTWLLHKLSSGILHVTDISNASSTGCFDPFTLCWSTVLFKLLNIPMEIFPQVVDSAGTHFGCISEDIFKKSIPIYCSISDQSASLFGSCCFNSGDVKITLGTGTFLDVNTGDTPHSSLKGLYPLVGWRFKNELVYVAEGASNDTGGLIKWAEEIDILPSPEESASIAESVGDNGGVYFVPAFNGLEAPVNDIHAAAGFIGLKPTTQKAHLLRAIIESIVFRVVQIVKIFAEERNTIPPYIRVDGGVANNDFILQKVADIVRIPIHRPISTEVSVLGAAFMAGIIGEFWKTKDDLLSLNKIEKKFFPQTIPKFQENDYENWCRAVERFCKWYSDDS